MSKISLANKSFDLQKIFDQVSPKYDLMNDLMSFGLHRYWKKTFIDLIPQKPSLTLLDLASGTGDIAFQFLQKAKETFPEISLCDPSPEMLEKSKNKAIDLNLKGHLSWHIGSAEKLPFPDQSFDVCTVSFGFRNFSDKKKSLQEIHRILKPGGVFLCLEFSQPKDQIENLYTLYLSTVLPFLGKTVAGHEEGYHYLGESIKHFPGAETLKLMIEQIGFKSVSYKSLTKGIVAIHRGWK